MIKWLLNQLIYSIISSKTRICYFNITAVQRLFWFNPRLFVLRWRSSLFNASQSVSGPPDLDQSRGLGLVWSLWLCSCWICAAGTTAWSCQIQFWEAALDVPSLESSIKGSVSALFRPNSSSEDVQTEQVGATRSLLCHPSSDGLGRAVTSHPHLVPLLQRSMSEHRDKLEHIGTVALSVPAPGLLLRSSHCSEAAGGDAASANY